MGSPSRNVQYHPPRLSEDRLNLPQPHSPTALLREIGNAPGRVLFADVAGVDEADPAEAPHDRHADLLVEDQQGVAAGHRPGLSRVSTRTLPSNRAMRALTSNGQRRFGAQLRRQIVAAAVGLERDLIRPRLRACRQRQLRLDAGGVDEVDHGRVALVDAIAEADASAVAHRHASRHRGTLEGPRDLQIAGDLRLQIVVVDDDVVSGCHVHVEADRAGRHCPHSGHRATTGRPPPPGPRWRHPSARGP